MKKALFLVVFFVGQLCLAQTRKPVIVPGTKCSLILPAGFEAASAFSGFQNKEKGASIIVAEVPSPYESMREAFSAENLKKGGMKLVSKQTVDGRNPAATLLDVTQFANGMAYEKQIYIFGDSSQTIMVSGVYPEAEKTIGPAIREALLSTVRNPLQNDNPLEAVPFTIDVSHTDFKFAKAIAGSLLYSADGKIPTDKPMLAVSNSIAKMSNQNRKEYAEQRLKKLPGGERAVVKQINAVTIDGLDGYELVAEGKATDNRPGLVYQVMLFNDQGDYFLIVGMSREDFDKQVNVFKKVARTFRRK